MTTTGRRFASRCGGGLDRVVVMNDQHQHPVGIFNFRSLPLSPFLGMERVLEAEQ